MPLTLKLRHPVTISNSFSPRTRRTIVRHSPSVVRRQISTGPKLSSESQQSSRPSEETRTSINLAHRLLNTAAKYLHAASTEPSPHHDAIFRARILSIFHGENHVPSISEIQKRMEEDGSALDIPYAHSTSRSHGACLAIIIMSSLL
jgi:hypothetical protein